MKCNLNVNRTYSPAVGVLNFIIPEVDYIQSLMPDFSNSQQLEEVTLLVVQSQDKKMSLFHEPKRFYKAVCWITLIIAWLLIL